MTPFLNAVYEELVARAASERYEARVRALRTAFDVRCGRFEPDHPEAGARDRAAWEDHLVAGGLAVELAELLDDPSERELARDLARSQRGVFELSAEDGVLLARDLWGAGVFVILGKDDVGRELTLGAGRDSPLCQGRLLGTLDGCAMLPGTVFHPADARDAVARVLDAARARGLSRDAALDAVLRMQHRFHTYTRVRVDLAYRTEALEEGGGT